VSDLNVHERGELPTISQVFDFHDGPEEGSPRIRLINFSGTPISAEQIQDLTDVIWWYSNASLGGIFENLRTIVIMPEGHSSMWVDREVDGQMKKIPRGGWQGPNVLGISERGFQPPEARSERPEELGAYFNQLLRPGETLGEPGSPKKSVSEGDPRITLAHEFWHRLMPSLFKARGIEDYSLYARSAEEEKEAEIGAAACIGGKAAESLNEGEWNYVVGHWKDYRENRLREGAKLGPRSVVCRQLDLNNGALPPAFKYNAPVVTAKKSYRLAAKTKQTPTPALVG